MYEIKMTTSIEKSKLIAIIKVLITIDTNKIVCNKNCMQQEKCNKPVGMKLAIAKSVPTDNQFLISCYHVMS